MRGTICLNIIGALCGLSEGRVEELVEERLKPVGVEWAGGIEEGFSKPDLCRDAKPEVVAAGTVIAGGGRAKLPAVGTLPKGRQGIEQSPAERILRGRMHALQEKCVEFAQRFS